MDERKGKKMTKRVGRLWVFMAAVSFIAAGSFALAHDPAKKTAGMHGMECGEHHSAAMKASDELSMHLAEAKRSTTLSAMRTHVEAADKAMTEMKNQMSMCMEMMNKMHGEKMGTGMGATAAAKVVDPVCGMEVDTASAPKATYAGKTYYFCSEDDKAKFQKNPEQYVRKN